MVILKSFGGEAPIGGVRSMFAMYNLRLRLGEFDDACYEYDLQLVEFSAIRWSPIGGVVDEASLQAPVGGVILTKS
ncbi:hypothetical protein H5410_040976 [Solanum commersonii]|uniref:Uncharacterized protein n=1 Tax=Solanum commersonii TaxID=4109 RepID=A0A9J5XU48_SOLCO|nr:hypothetical protein H5410_040976 [Solanum commersonii]